MLNFRDSTLVSLWLIVALLLLATCLGSCVATCTAQPISPLASITAQRDAAVRQRNALFAERNALRDERRELLRVCRAHGMSADEKVVVWLDEVLLQGTERYEWNKIFEQPKE